MSFILDALKKLEREKESARPGVVMVGPVAWGARDRSRSGRRLAAAGAGFAAVVAVGWWWLGSSGAPPSGPPDEAAGSALVSQPAPAPLARDLPAQAPPAHVTAPPVPATDDLLPEEPRRGPAPTLSAPPPAAEGTPSPPLATVGTPVPEEESATAEPQADPVVLEDRPVVAEDEAPLPEYRLTAISERDGKPIALLNDRLVHEGDRFGDLTVIRIGETEVEIEVKGERKIVGF
jgi:hypothetical protein